MSSIIFGNISSLINKGFSGGGVGSTVGKMAGKFFGQMLNRQLWASSYSASYDGERLEKINVQTVKYGRDIPIIYGHVKLSGNIVWDSGLKELKDIITKRHSKSGDSYQSSYTEYEYKISLAIALCEGKIEDVLRIWADNRPLNISKYTIRIHKGGEDQMPDPLIEKIEGKNKTPAYRGLAYVVIEDFPVGDFNNKVPAFSFEVKRGSVFQDDDKLENLISAVVMIPGGGEFVYDIEIQKKVKKGKTAHSKEKITNINAHTEKTESNAVVSLNQLRDTLPRVKWVSPTINWFATSLDAKDCEVLPGVEFRDGNITTTPNSWKVAGFERHNARLITQKKKSPIYDGTTNDASILRYLQTLKNRGYKVMLYPMMLVDNIKKPWRGRIHANSAQDINHFFDSKNGYKKFIIHYANLAKGHVDAFIIGSELIGLTKFKDKDNKFPAVDKLIELAGEVKKILGSSVKISYGADWSEYHHTDGGWYNLDKLWASPNIDFVGIDAYFPLTDTNNTVMNHKEVMLGWDSGEGFDYHFDHTGKKQPLAKEYAWKNIEWWWGNPHFNPDGKRTEWRPKAKKIWFTEVGFPSIDCATNQPSVSFDPYGSESGVPKYSRGKIDFYAQKVGLLATELRWKNSEMVENKFVWAWDARPYPYWPDRSDVWPDAACWFTGYWIQGKLGQSTLRKMLAEICMKSGINENQFNVNLINKHISGFYIFNHTTARDVIDNLRELYCFDVVDDGGVICFIPRENKQVYQIDYGDVIMAKNGKSTFCTQSVSGSERISRICLNYIKQEHAFILTNVYADDNMAYAKNNKNLSVPIVFQEADAKDIVNKMMKNIMSGRILYEFVLPIKYIFLKPSDVVKIEYNNQDHLIRLTNISITSQQTIEVFGIAESEDNIA